MPPTPITPVPVPTDSNPGNETLVTSGSDSSGITQDWYVHIQIVEMMYLRQNQYNLDTSSTITAPVAESSYLDVHYTIQTQDEIYLNATFSGELWKPHTLELLPQGAGSAGGFGVCGAINTSTVGYIRRAVRKDAAGNILDPSGTCTSQGNLIMDQSPGAYDGIFDTSAQANSNLIYAMGGFANQCPTFLASLVQL